jgi:hypothetical protein
MTWLAGLFVLIAVITAMIAIRPENAAGVAGVLWIFVMVLALLTAFIFLSAQ